MDIIDGRVVKAFHILVEMQDGSLRKAIMNTPQRVYLFNQVIPWMFGDDLKVGPPLPGWGKESLLDRIMREPLMAGMFEGEEGLE